MSVTRDEAYDRIDRILRNNLDDTDYATFLGYLELVYGVGQWDLCPKVPGASCASAKECATGCVRLRAAVSDEQIVAVWEASEGYRPGHIAQRDAIALARAIEREIRG